MPWTQKWSVLVEVELFKGTLKIQNHRILMMEHCLTDKETCPFYQKACIQIYYPQVLCHKSKNVACSP